jgi:hypothetical protein
MGIKYVCDVCGHEDDSYMRIFSVEMQKMNQKGQKKEVQIINHYVCGYCANKIREAIDPKK